MNLARLNHILIPETKAGRDRWRRTRTGRLLGKLFGFWTAFSSEGHFLLVFWLMSGAVSLNVDATQYYLLWAGVSGLLVASIGLRPLFGLKDVAIQVQGPARVMVGEPATFTVELSNHGSVEHQNIRVSGPFLPWDGRYLGEAPAIARLEPGQTARTRVQVRFAARGEHHLDPFGASAVAPLGLCTGPGVESQGNRFLVVPRIAPIQTLRTPTNQRYQPGGVALASRTGESRELIGVRPYRPGDPIRDLHASRWARLGEPMVREFQQEYFTRIGVVVDTDAAAGDEALEAGLSLAAGVVAHLSRGEALIDLIVVGDRLLRLTLGRSLGFLEQALDLLATVEPGPPLDPRVLESRLAPYLSRLSCVVLVALEWDAPRQGLADWVERNGVGCRTLQVTRDQDREADARSAAGVTRISVEHLLSGQELSL